MIRVENCIFCKITERKIPSKIIYEDGSVLAFLDIFPISKGHTIVICKNHYSNLENIPENELTGLYKIVQKIAINNHKKLKIDGYNILQNNFPASGQVIEHFHVHIIPRNEDDRKFDIKVPRTQASKEELEKIYNILKL
jgi:histidine triad (HIT) family protein